MPSDHVRPVAEGVLVEYQQALALRVLQNATIGAVYYRRLPTAGERQRHPGEKPGQIRC